MLSTTRRNLFLSVCKVAKVSSSKSPTLAICLKLLEKFVCFRRPVEDVCIALPVLKVLMAFLFEKPWCPCGF